MKRRQKTWIDGLIGWKAEGSVVETYWFGDPAIDQGKSDMEAYLENLGKEHLVVKQGEKPSRLLVSLPTSAQWGNIQVHMNDAGHGAAPIVAFQLCVRFPDVEGAEATLEDGMRRLPEGLMAALATHHPTMITTIGYWVINKYLLSTEEKKASSPESTVNGSSNDESMTASNAPTGEKDCKGARTSARKRGRKQKTGTSG